MKLAFALLHDVREIKVIRHALKIGLCLFSLTWAVQSFADEKHDYQLGSGDSIHIVVYRNPDLGVDTRITEGGTITYPLLGSVHVGGLTIAKAEELIAKGLRDGGFVQQPQVNITLVTVRGNLVSILGQVNHPGLYPLESLNMHLTEVLALAGGASVTGGDKVILIGTRQGKSFRKEVDLGAIFSDTKIDDDPVIFAGDKIYVPIAAVFYIFGEVQRPGSFRFESGMSVMQALAQGGGLTPRGTERNIQLHRRNAKGTLDKLSPEMADHIQPNDVIYVKESLF
jgi:polysaccharide biosynthesis/export protein